MSRYIDADKLIEMLNKKAETDLEMGLYNHGALTQSFIRFVERQPTEDVVEVVRCKDCKHSYFVKSCSKYECQKGCGTLKYANDYCSYGERKER